MLGEVDTGLGLDGEIYIIYVYMLYIIYDINVLGLQKNALLYDPPDPSREEDEGCISVETLWSLLRTIKSRGRGDGKTWRRFGVRKQMHKHSPTTFGKKEDDSKICLC